MAAPDRSSGAMPHIFSSSTAVSMSSVMRPDPAADL